ncbi:Phospholipase/carboxylesterase/thioesterase [Geopyxis carbonaria]|nr:Phospholipase/carboxylesterase/thioesterase [Geopyxis carbonaria]
MYGAFITLCGVKHRPAYGSVAPLLHLFLQSTPRSNFEPAKRTYSSVMSSVPAVVVPAAKTHTSTLIFLHGLGDTGNGWSSVSENFRLRRKFDECAFIFPHAPRIPITVNMGMQMPGWFDLVMAPSNTMNEILIIFKCSFSDFTMREDETGMLKSINTVHTIIEEQIAKGISSERIIIGGFSQGGAIALLAGISCKHKLGGIVAMSTWIALRDKVSTMATDANKGIPIFQAHGEIDYVVRFDWGELTKKLLLDMGHPVEWHQYPGLDHSADPQEIADLEEWMEKRIPTRA